MKRAAYLVRRPAGSKCAGVIFAQLVVGLGDEALPLLMSIARCENGVQAFAARMILEEKGVPIARADLDADLLGLAQLARVTRCADEGAE